MWQCITVCPATSPQFIPMLNPWIDWSDFFNSSCRLIISEWTAFTSGWARSKYSEQWRFGMMIECPSDTGNSSGMTNARRFSWSVSFFRLQKIQDESRWSYLAPIPRKSVWSRLFFWELHVKQRAWKLESSSAPPLLLGSIWSTSRFLSSAEIPQSSQRNWALFKTSYLIVPETGLRQRRRWSQCDPSRLISKSMMAFSHKPMSSWDSDGERFSKSFRV